jgi:nucleoside-diphosphate-sugar epimerase
MSNIYTIFGSTGFFGKNLKEFLIKKKCKVFCPSKKKYKFNKNLGHVFYCSGTSESVSDPDKALNANLMYLNNIILNNRFKSFTYYSSIRVYSSNKSSKEDDKIICDLFEKGTYFKNLKLAAESLCLQINNPQIRIIRLPNLYGKYFNKQIYLLPTILRNIKNNKRIKLTIDYSSTKNYLNVEDAVKISIQIAKKGKFRIYNVASKSVIKVGEIFKILNKIKKFKMEVPKNNKITHEPKINIKRVQEEFNFFEKESFNKSFSNLIKNYYK